MLEHIVAIFAGTLALGMVTWHITRVISDGALFEPLRNRLWDKHQKQSTGFRFRMFYAGLSCRLCFGTQIAIILTWGALLTGLIVKASELPPAEWGFAFAVGPFLTAAWGEIIRRVEAIEAPE